MNKVYRYEIRPADIVSGDFQTIEECVEACKAECVELDVDYDDRDVMLFLSDDYGETWEECTEEGELAG